MNTFETKTASAPARTPARETNQSQEQSASQTATGQAEMSLFRSVKASKPLVTITLLNFAREIRDGAHRKAIEKLRLAIALEDPDTEQLKKAITAVTLSGTITTGGREYAMEQGRFDHNGLLQVDIDGKDNPGIVPEETRDMTASDPHIVLAFVSPSGDGVKGVMRIPVCHTKEEHVAAFVCMQEYMLATYGLTIDGSTKDTARLCFVSYDPAAKWNSTAVPLVIPEPEPAPPKDEKPKASKTPAGPRIVLSEHSQDDWTIADLDDMLARVPAPVDQYQVWLDAISGAWNTLGEAATPILIKHWPEEKPGEYDAKFASRESKPTILKIYSMAKAYGWKPTPRQKALAARGLDDNKTGEGENKDAKGATGGKDDANPSPFEWNITPGAETWTHDPLVISSLSDPSIIDGLLREREVGSVVGAAKTSKTWFTLALALKVATGEPFLGMTTHRRKVLYLDYELKPATLRKRMSMLAADKPEGFFYQCLRGESRLPTVREIADLVEREGFGLVVADSLYRTGWISEENNNDSTPRDMAPLQDFTRRVPCSLLCVDHTAKGGGNDRSAVDAARGASAKAGFWDCLLVLRPTDKGPDPEGNYAILDPVLRDWPRFDQLPLVSFSWHGTGCDVEVAGEVDRGESDATATRILEIIAGAENGISRPAIAAASDIGETTVRRHLEALTRKGKAVEFCDPSHRQRKLYRLPDMADEPRQTAPNPAA